MKTILFINTRRVPSEGYLAILAARQLGYNVLLISNKIPDYAKSLVIHTIEINTSHHERVLEEVSQLAKRYTISGIPCWNEADVIIVSKACEMLNLPGLNIFAAHRARNKYLMKESLSSLPTILPKFYRVSNLEEAKQAILEIGLPAIIKPTAGAGSKGVFKILSSTDIQPALDYLVDITRPEHSSLFNEYINEYIVEEYIEGKEFSVEGMIIHNEPVIIGITDKWTTDPYFIEYQHIFPSYLTDNIQNEIIVNTKNIIKKLDLNHCAFHLEAKWTTRGFKFIEIAARIAGDHITSSLIQSSTGIDCYKAIICLSVDQKPDINQKYLSYSGVRFIMADKAGVLHDFKGLGAVLQQSGVQRVIIETPLKSYIDIPPKQFGSSRVASVHAIHQNYDQCLDILNKAVYLIEPIIHS